MHFRITVAQILGLLQALASAPGIHAMPTPQDVTVIGPGIIPGWTTTEEICSATYDDPFSTWVLSGAGHFLAGFIQDNTANNWANKIDQQTTAGGSQGVSNLACTDLLAGNCAFPTVQCRFYTPPELFHIRNAMANAHAMMTGLHEGLQNAAIVESLHIDRITSDFGPPSAANSAGLLNAAFTIAAGAAAPEAILAGPLTIIAGIFGILASSGSSGDNPALAVQDQLAKTFSDADAQLKNLASAVFGGVNTEIIPNPEGLSDPITAFFSQGKYLVKVTPEGSVDAIASKIISLAQRYIRQRLVNAALKANNYYIFVDTDITDFDSCTNTQGTGSGFINNECFQIHSFARADVFTAGESTRIDAEKVLKLDDGVSGYDFHVEDFYSNANDCANKHPNFDGELNGSVPTVGNSEHDYPECFFDLPVIKASKTPCAFGDKSKLPENLGISDETCKRVDRCLGNPGFCIPN